MILLRDLFNLDILCFCQGIIHIIFVDFIDSADKGIGTECELWTDYYSGFVASDHSETHKKHTNTIKGGFRAI